MLHISVKINGDEVKNPFLKVLVLGLQTGLFQVISGLYLLAILGGMVLEGALASFSFTNEALAFFAFLVVLIPTHKGFADIIRVLLNTDTVSLMTTVYVEL